MKNEAQILRTLNHPGVLGLESTFSDNQNLYLVLDYALNKDFSSFLQNNRKFLRASD